MSHNLLLRKCAVASLTSNATSGSRHTFFRMKRTFVSQATLPQQYWTGRCQILRKRPIYYLYNILNPRQLDLFQNQSLPKQERFYHPQTKVKSRSSSILSNYHNKFYGTMNKNTTRIQHYSNSSKNHEQHNIRAAIQRNKLIVKLGRSGNWRDILLLYKEEGDQFTNANYATTMTSLSRIRSFPKRDPIFHTFLQDIAQTLQHPDGIKLLGTRATSNILHGIAKMNLKTSRTHDIIQNFMEPTNATWFIQNGNGQDISNVLWSLAKLQFRPHPNKCSSSTTLFQQVEQNMEQIIMGFNDGDGGNYNRQDDNNNNDPGRKGNEEEHRRRVAASPVEVTNIVWALATLGIQAPKAFEIVHRYAVWLAHEGQSHHIIRILWAFAKMNIQPPTLIQELEKRSDILFLKNSGMKKMTNNHTDNILHDVSNVIWSFAKLGIIPSSNLVRSMERAIVELKHNNDNNERRRQSSYSPTLSPQAMANIAWSFATLGIYSPIIFAEIEKNAQTLVYDGSPQAISNTAWAFATLRIHSPWLFEMIDQVGAKLVKDGSTQAIANAAWAFASVGYESKKENLKIIDKQNNNNAPCLAFFHEIQDNVHLLLENANVQEIITLCYSIVLQKDGCKHYEDALRPLWNRAMELATPTSSKTQGHEDTLTDYDLRQLIQIELFAISDAIYLQKPSPQLRKRVDNVGWDNVQNASPNDISTELKELGFSHEQEVSPIQSSHKERECKDKNNNNTSGKNGSFFAIDLANEEKRIAIEYNGSPHFLRDIDTGDIGRVEDGATKAKRRFLEKNGWDVISIDYQDWIEAENQGNTKDFLMNKLRKYVSNL